MSTGHTLNVSWSTNHANAFNWLLSGSSNASLPETPITASLNEFRRSAALKLGHPEKTVGCREGNLVEEEVGVSL
jgi:hypothetical protein